MQVTHILFHCSPAGAADGTVSAWNMSSRPGSLVRSLKCEKYVTCVQLVDDIKLATSSADGKVGVMWWEWGEGEGPATGVGWFWKPYVIPRRRHRQPASMA
jgi:hypothetical protein